MTHRHWVLKLLRIQNRLIVLAVLEIGLVVITTHAPPQKWREKGAFLRQKYFLFI